MEKNGDICIFNKGSVNRISHKDLPYDYYYHVDKKDTENKELMLYSLSNIQLELYTNFVFCDDSFEILENIDEFLERSVYKNICFSFNMKDLKMCSQSFGWITLMIAVIKIRKLS